MGVMEKFNGHTELKPCPFCGGGAKVFREKLPICHEYRVKCLNENCKVFIPYSLYMKDAIRAWNTRADDDLKSRNAELVECLKELCDAESAADSHVAYKKANELIEKNGG
jgi:Lar family restriction alleviation protein